MSCVRTMRIATLLLPAAIGLYFATSSSASAQIDPPIIPTPIIGHSGDITALALSHDGQWLASAGTDHSVKLWQRSSGRLLRTLNAIPIQSSRDAEQGHQMTAVTFGPDDELLIAGDSAGVVHVWEVGTGEPVKVFQAHAGKVENLQVIDNAKTILTSGHFDHDFPAVGSWQIRTGERLAGAGKDNTRISLAPNGTSVMSFDALGSRLHDARTLRILRDLPDASNATDIALQVASGGSEELLIQQYKEGVAQLSAVDLKTGRRRRTFALPADSSAVALSDGWGALILDRSRGYNPPEMSIEVWTLYSDPVKKVKLSRRFTPDAALLSMKYHLVVTARGGTIEIWDTETGKLLRIFEGPTPITSLSISGDGTALIADSEDGRSRLWRPFEAKLERLVEMDGRPSEAAMFLPQSNRAITRSGETRLAASDHGLGDWHVSTPGWTLIEDPFVEDWKSEPPGRLVAMASSSGSSIGVWDTEIDKFHRTIELPENAGSPTEVHLSPNLAWAAVMTQKTAGTAGSFFLWNLAKNTLELQLPDIAGFQIWSAAFSPDSKRLAICASGRPFQSTVIVIRNLERGESEKQLRIDNTEGYGRVLFSRAGKYLTLYSIWRKGRTRRVFRTSDWGALEASVLTNWQDTSNAFYDQDNRILVTERSRSRGVRIRKLVTSIEPGGRNLREFTTTGLVDTRVDPAGKVLAVPDGPHVRLIALDDGHQLGMLTGHLGDVTALEFFPDGRWLATGAKDGTIRIWRLRTDLLTDSKKTPLVATYLGGRESEWLAISPAGFYTGSYGAGRMLSVVHGLDAYSIDQFYEPLYRGELIKESLTGDPTGRYQDAAARLNLKSVVAYGPPPTITLIEKNRIGDVIRLKVRLFNNEGGGVGRRLIWRINGATEGPIEPEELRNLQDPNGPVDVAINFKLDFSRANVITVTAFNGADRSANDEERRRAFATEPSEFTTDEFGTTTPAEGPRPRMHILAVGVDTYKTPRLEKLELATKDVLGLADALQKVSRAGGYEDGLRLERTEKSAVKDLIEQAFQQLSGEVNRQDAFVLLLAGHGQSVSGRGYFYYPSNAEFTGDRNFETEGISTELWQKWIAMVPAGKKLIVVDTCQSSDAIAVVRGDDDLAQETTVDRLRHAVGHSVVTAAREVALESNFLGHGVLTYAILEALAMPRSDGGAIDLKTLDARIEPAVKLLSVRLGGKPQSTYNKIVGNFDLGKPLASVAPAHVDQSKTAPGNYVLRITSDVREEPRLDAKINHSLDEGTRVGIKWIPGTSWAEISRGGVPQGYVPGDVLLRLID